MQLQVKGKITEIGKKDVGISKSGKEWSKIDFVIETQEQYAKNICFTLFNDNCELIYDKSEGQEVNVTFGIESKEYNGRWFSNVTAFGIASLQEPEETNSGKAENTDKEQEEGDGLPF